MKKGIISLSILGVFALVIIALSSFTVNQNNSSDTPININTHVHAEGKHCTYSVGCSCAGFSPITNGDEWQKSYCKRCGHHKRYHK